jgi:hypothetical protein
MFLAISHNSGATNPQKRDDLTQVTLKLFLTPTILQALLFFGDQHKYGVAYIEHHAKQLAINLLQTMSFSKGSKSIDKSDYMLSITTNCKFGCLPAWAGHSLPKLS